MATWERFVPNNSLTRKELETPGDVFTINKRILLRNLVTGELIKAIPNSVQEQPNSPFLQRRCNLFRKAIPRGNPFPSINRINRPEQCAFASADWPMLSVTVVAIHFSNRLSQLTEPLGWLFVCPLLGASFFPWLPLSGFPYAKLISLLQSACLRA